MEAKAPVVENPQANLYVQSLPPTVDDEALKVSVFVTLEHAFSEA